MLSKYKQQLNCGRLTWAIRIKSDLKGQPLGMHRLPHSGCYWNRHHSPRFTYSFWLLYLHFEGFLLEGLHRDDHLGVLPRVANKESQKAVSDYHTFRGVFKSACSNNFHACVQWRCKNLEITCIQTAGFRNDRESPNAACVGAFGAPWSCESSKI